jgi:Spy/CpxP family protein refolding chaperone
MPRTLILVASAATLALTPGVPAMASADRALHKPLPEPRFRHGDLERRDRHHQQVLHGAMLALAQDCGAGHLRDVTRG